MLPPLEVPSNLDVVVFNINSDAGPLGDDNDEETAAADAASLTVAVVAAVC